MNKGDLSGIADELAEYAAPGLQDIGKTRGKIARTATAGASSASRRGSAVSSIAASSRWRWRERGAVRRRHLADLARDQLQPAAVERAAERHRDGPAPYQLSSMMVASSPAMSSAVRKPVGRGARVKDEIAIGRRRVGRGEAQVRAPAASAGARRIDVDQRHLRAVDAARREIRPARRPRRRRPPRCGRTGPAPASHMAFSAVSMLAASTARDGGMSPGTGTTASAGRSNMVWCGCSAKTLRPIERRRPGLDLADRGVAVFHRERESAAP